MAPHSLITIVFFFILVIHKVMVHLLSLVNWFWRCMQREWIKIASENVEVEESISRLTLFSDVAHFKCVCSQMYIFTIIIRYLIILPTSCLFIYIGWPEIFLDFCIGKMSFMFVIASYWFHSIFSHLHSITWKCKPIYLVFILTNFFRKEMTNWYLA